MPAPGVQGKPTVTVSLSDIQKAKMFAESAFLPLIFFVGKVCQYCENTAIKVLKAWIGRGRKMKNVFLNLVFSLFPGC